MKSDIHPTYYSNAKVKCACGNEFIVGSTYENIEVEICSACHPFYTGQEKIIDTAGRVERFRAREKAASEKKKISITVKKKKTTTPKNKPVSKSKKNNKK